MFCVVYILSSLIGMLICGIGFDISGGEMLIRHAVGISTLLVLTVLFTSLSLIFRKRAVPIVLSIVVVMLLSTATSIVGNYNLPAKAADDYIELRHERYEDLVEEGVLTDDQVEEIEEEVDRDYYLDIGWKICHPAYLFTTTGYNGDYSTDPLQIIIGEFEYKDEIDFTSKFVTDYYNMDMSGITPKDLKHIDSMHLSYTKLNIFYTVKSGLWILAIGACGYVIFRKKNLF